ncbi:MAG: hypothetical protein Q9160_008382 [Pyrenula sp. 1 TL-2023]
MASQDQSINDIFDALRARNSDNAPWYRGEPSAVSEPPQHVCSKILRHVHLLDLTKDELQLMKSHWTCDTLQNHIADLHKASERKTHGPAYEKSRSFLYGFSRFADRTCDIVQMALPTGSEYSAALAVIALFARPLNIKAEKEEKILAQVEEVADLLPTVEYLKKALQTAPMMQAVSGICAEVAAFLYEALCYYKKPRLEKFVSSLISNYEDKFSNHATSIQRHVGTMQNLQNTAVLALQLDAFEKLDQTATLLLKIHQASELRAANIEAKIDDCMSSITRQAKTTASIHAQSLSEALISQPLNTQEIVRMIELRRGDLPSSDLWESHGSSIDISPWLQSSHRPLLWLSGPSRPGRISWVSSFVVDFIAALTLEPEIQVGAVFCTNGGIDPCTIVKNLIQQILDNLRSLPLESHLAFPIRRFRNVGNSTKLAFELLYDLLDALESQPAFRGKGFFIIIDRIDLCTNTADCGVEGNFIPAIQQIATRFVHLNVVLSSAEPAENNKLLDHNSESLMSIWVNTLKPMAMKQR